MITSRFIKPLFAIGFAGLALSATPQVHAQAQSLLTSNQVVITRVENINSNVILISGINFDKFDNVPVVSLSGTGSTVSTLPSAHAAAASDITALLPPNIASLPGSYRLMVSFDNGSAGSDVFEFTVGAVGPQGATGDKGEKGDKGDQGIQGVQGEIGLKGEKGEKGDRGDQGIQGVKGDKGDTGLQGEKGAQGIQGLQGVQGVQGAQGFKGDTGATGAVGPAGKSGNFPIYQNVNEARSAGIAVGQIWVQASSGQVFQMVK